ncbi:MAG: hypothetical protein COY82_01375 [Parcubacteria group bacterium CG_4_10_14_0_8_um_filter_35_7]|nr:MAG: hypothetical protein COY82_01375 [Parcubacteria group bacterium CG_4_10_14_0_8_um_filter_35_7]
MLSEVATEGSDEENRNYFRSRYPEKERPKGATFWITGYYTKCFRIFDLFLIDIRIDAIIKLIVTDKIILSLFVNLCKFI